MGNKNSRSNGESDSQRSEESERSSTTSPESNPSYYTMLKNSYQALVNAIIRPPRCNYDIDQLGPHRFRFCNKTFQRLDFSLVNKRNLKLECSIWEPIETDRPSVALPCVIYMHGNSSARPESLSALSMVLSLGATLLAFDFTGSGKSQGDYVSLGAFEKDDLQAVIEFLRESGKVSTIALWGRSMGAATALLHAERDPSIAAMILDSAFADLVMLAEEMVEKGRQNGLFAPGILVKIAMRFIRSSVLKTAGFDIRNLSPIDHADRCFIPALFIAAEGDNFVLPSHSQKIYEKYGGDKNIILVEGDHNTPRPRYMFDSIFIFLQTTLQIPIDWCLPEGEQYIRKAPWTYRATKAHNNMNNVNYKNVPTGLTAEELLAIQLMNADGLQFSQLAEIAMQQGIEENLFQLLSSNTNVSKAKLDRFAKVTSTTIAKSPLPPLPPSKQSNNTEINQEETSLTSPPISIPSNTSIPSTNIPTIPSQSHPNTTNNMNNNMNNTNKTTEELLETLQHTLGYTHIENQSVKAIPPIYYSDDDDSMNYQNQNEYEEEDLWVCKTCTLINPGYLDLCSACGLPH